MLSAFFVNFCILVTFTSAGSLTFTGDERHHLVRRLLRYLISVAAGIVLVLYGVLVGEGVRVDFRNVPVLLAGLFGGPLPALLVALPIMVYRLWVGGVGAPAGIMAVALVALLASALHPRFARNRLTWHDLWVPFAVFACANLSLLAVPGSGVQLFRSTFLLLVVLQGLAALIAFSVISLRFSAVGHTATLQDIAYLDALTTLHNRRRFDADLPTLGLEDGAFLLLLDLDRFKQLNDTYGHPFGDQVLRELARLLQEGVRGTDRVYRVGGEEFGVLLRQTSPAGARMVAERLRSSVQEQLAARVGRPGQSITISVGLTPCGNEPAETVRRADTLLYQAKHAGRNQVVAAT
ncbi:diguanylate cyclase [Deinococcus phoenicis]|uniref:Diguanylate cyclase n=1 Tax=Deinococcus phoenicis TaxID=1476583 RepID=A0A016QS41_9DEIO|nr:diguanylate cyclase [Deinococcus phoenicis]EYB68564.1 diguanylate cyclase [Deinococcus phoenicis]